MIEELEKKGCRKEVVKLLLFCIHEDIPGSMINASTEEISNTLKEMNRVGIIEKNYSTNKIKLKVNPFGTHPKEYTISDEKRVEKDVREIVKANLHRYRMAFKGTDPGKMGAPKSCENKLVRWLTENPEYTIEDVINTAKYYVDFIFSKDGHYKYLRQADYFIFKREGSSKEESSTLSSYIDDGKDFNGSINKDWTSRMI